MKALIVVSLAWAGLLYWTTGKSYVVGYEQGVVAGIKRAEARESVTERCMQWWFQDSKKTVKYHLDQYCKRTGQ